MVFDVSAPSDSDLASGISEYIRDAKVEVRQRMVCDSGTFKEHHESDSEDFGLHIASRTSFCRVSTWDDRLTAEDRLSNTLHFIIEPDSAKGLYTITPDLEYRRMSLSDHAHLSGLEGVNDHPQLVFLLEGKTEIGPLDLYELMSATDYPNDQIVSSNKPIDASHRELEWFDAHGEDSVHIRHFATHIDRRIEANDIADMEAKQELDDGLPTPYTFGGPGDSFQETLDNDKIPFVFLPRAGGPSIRPIGLQRLDDKAIRMQRFTQGDLPYDVVEEITSCAFGTPGVTGEGGFGIARWRV